jgi:glycosyltransferase involved in cell wall biosynthesis
MPRCLIVTPFPIAVPRHGGQVRAASIQHALRLAGWQVDAVGLYHADFFPPEDWGVLDIVIGEPSVARRALDDMLFADLHIARAAAADSDTVDQLRAVLTRLQPDVVHVEHPWDWLVLQQALPSGPRPRVVYSSQNIEWRSRPPMFKLGLERPGAARLVEATRLLEEEFARSADLVLSISDLERDVIAANSGREIVYVPPVSDLAQSFPAVHSAFSRAARESCCRYAALMGSAYWPNVEGVFSVFPDGLGGLAPDEQIWVAGSLGAALRDDPRFHDFQSINDSRLRAWGYVADADKASFFAAAACVIVPVYIGGGAKLKTADALASGCPVITTSHALEGYGPLVQDVLGRGVYVADSPREFRSLIRQALREGLAGCPPEIRERVSPRRLSDTLSTLFAAAIAAPTR